MFRTISFALFLFIDLSCCDTLTGNVRRVTDQVIETQISTTTDKEFWSTTSSGVDSDDFDMRLTSEETTETTQITSSYDDDVYLNNGSVCEIRNVTYKSYSDSIEIEWYDCGDTYNVNRNKSVFDDKEMPDFRRLVNNSTYKFAKLEECTPYNISIKSYSGDEYLKTIRTLPGEIQDLTTYIEGNVTYVNWSLPESQDCQTFNIQINEMVMTQIKNNSLEINYDVSRCTRIKINAVDINNTIGNISTRQVPGTVLDFSPIFYEDNITLSWKPPEDMTCVTGYVVQLNDEAVLLNDSSTTGYSFTGLQACTEYTVGVAVRSSTDVGEYLYVTDKTDTPTIIAAVESFQLVILNDTLRATWEPPSSQSACITGYGVVMWSDSATVTNSTTDTYYNFTPTVPCKTYNVMIKAMIGTNEGISTIESTTIDPAATDAPTLKSIVVNETSATITLKLEDYTSNMCQVTMVIVNCTAEGNQPSDWIIEERHVEHSHTDPSREASILVDDISAYTHYVCYAYVINTGGESEESVAIEFRTLEGVPSEPRNLAYTVDDHIVITWTEPLTIPGVLGNYSVKIEGINPLHYIPQDCSVYPSKIDEQTGGLQFHFNDYSFNYKYKLVVAASTGAGFGDEATINITTPVGEPEAPRDISHTSSHEKLEVNWKAPCNTNGELIEFRWTLEGQQLEDGDNLTSINGTVLANEDVSNVTYGLSIENIQARYLYTFTLAAYTIGDLRGIETNFTLVSADGFPSAPQNVTLVEVNATSAEISWAVPLTTNGLIVSYLLVLNTTGPKHYIPENCPVDYTDSIKIEPESTKLSYILESVMPYFQYNVSVSAATTAGYGDAVSVDFITLQAEPDAPRYIDHTHNMTENNTDAVTIKWLQPCNTNGNLINFAWVLWGYSLETGDVHNDSGIIKSNDPLNDTLYELTLSNLLPYHTYNVSIAARVEGDILGEEMVQGFISNDGLPSAPSGLESTNISSSLIVVIWKEPYPRNGEIQTYRVTVSSQGPLYEVPQDCAIDIASNDPQKLPSDLLTFTVTDAQPNFKYIIGIAASTRTGYGDESLIELESLPTDPESLENIKTEINYNQTENYEAEAIMTFDKQCNLHGDFSHYEVDIFGTRSMSYNVEFVRNITTYETNQLTIPLTPDFRYYGHIIIHTTTGHKTTIIESFVAPAGVPAVSTANIESPKANPTNATFTLSNEIFNNSGGNIKYYAIIISIGNDLLQNVGGTYAFWNESSWPEVGFWSATAMEHEYQATPERWNPFVNASETTEHTYVIGGNNCSSTSNIYCNGPLRPNTRYGLRIRGFTAAAYRDTRMVYFTTPTERSYLALILGVIFGALAAILVLLFIFILWRRRKKETVDAKETLVVVQTPKPPPIPKSRFEEHCQMFEGNRNELKAEYSHLEGLSAAGKPSSDVAMADNNKKKNRYVNIMAYDVTRVKLTINNNDNCEDYINASYIKGYSGNHEYIATQGPMESTLEDFWRMIVQEDVGLIVMVAQFVEQSKQKCYKYFPEKEETMTIGKGDILVKCTNEADMTDYVTRSLIVEKDGEQLMIKHLQFMLWPDFGCPTTTHSMLEFRDIMRKHIEVTKTKAVIHCSAGVGRTGTLIAIDILLQKIDNSDDDIDVFGTVLDLRRQRTHMVQTEKQYEYIHKCLRDYLIKPKQASDDAGDFDPIYENVAVLNGYSDRLHNENNLSTENLIRLKEL